MKLFQYDDKHQAVHGEIDLGKLSHAETNLVVKILLFLEKQRMVNRYSSLILAEGYTIEVEDGENLVVFNGETDELKV